MPKKIFFLPVLAMVLVLAGAGCITTSSSTFGPRGFFRSMDKGDSWEAASALPTADGVGNIGGINVYRLAEDPSDSDAYYLGTRGQGLFYTYDNGTTWRIVKDEKLSDKFIYDIAVDPKNKCIIYATDGAHIYQSKDCSRSFTLMFTEERVEQYFVALGIDTGSGNIYGVQAGGDLLKSADAGKSWQVINRFSGKVKDMMLDPLTPGRIYVAGESTGLYRSDNGGVDWLDLSEAIGKFDNGKKFYRFALNKARSDSLFWVCKYGILRSDDAGETWQDLKLLTPPGSVQIYGFAVNPQNEKEIYYTGTILDDKNQPVKSTFYKSVDGGNTWVTKKLPTNTIPVAIKVHPDNDSMIFMAFTLL